MKQLIIVSLFLLLLTALNAFCQPAIKTLESSQETGKLLSMNGDFESIQGGSFTDWNQYEEGYTVAQGAGRNGSNALYCESPDVKHRLGGSQAIILNQTQPYPIRVSCWSKCESVDGSASSDYSIYLDLECVDGTPIWGQLRAFPTGTSDWNHWQYVIYPTRPVKSIAAHCLFRNRKGKVWFDDVRIEELTTISGVKMLQGQAIQLLPIQGKRAKSMDISTNNGLSMSMDGASVASLKSGNKLISCETPSGFLVRDVGKNSDYYGFSKVKTTKTSLAAECPEMGVRLDARFESNPDFIRVTGNIVDTTSKDRAINLMFALPVDASGWTWWDDMRRGRDITKITKDNVGLEYIKSNDIPCGSTTSASVYPVAAITGPTDGLSIGIDMGKIAVYRVFYNSSTHQLAISYDFGLVPETQRFPSSAEFSFVIYKFDPKWGFRQSWSDFARIFPDYFKVRSTKHGIWMPFGDISRVQGWQDFGFRYKEGIDNVPFDLANDILSFRYSEPTTWWMSMPKGGDRSETAVMAERDRIAATDDGIMAKAVINSGMEDARGKPCYQVLDTPWCDGVVWNMNPNPYIPQLPNGGSVLWNDKIREADYGPTAKNVRAGEYLDSLEGYVTSDLNYKREHFKYTTVPLTFDDQRRPVLFKGMTIYEMVKWIAGDVHRIGKLMFANGVPYRFTYLCPWLDVMGTETNWLFNGKYVPETDDVLIMRRTLCYGKPYLFLMNTRFNDFGVDMVEKYFKRSGFYGIFPGMFSYDAANEAYFDNPKWYNRDRHLFKKYIPIIKRISEAGWEPITYARSSNQDVILERFGKRYITVMNDGKESKSAEIQINTAKLNLKPAFQARDLFSGKDVVVKGSSFNVSLPAGEVMVVDLTP